jgi:hypothetical protein
MSVMQDERRDETRPRRAPTIEVIRELEAEIDERDEIIRQLNEALSRALDELTSEPEIAA